MELHETETLITQYNNCIVSLLCVYVSRFISVCVCVGACVNMSVCACMYVCTCIITV